MSYVVTRDCTLREMLDAMEHLPDDAVFRFFQMSTVNERGEPTALDTLRLTMGQIRKELPRP